MSGPGQLEDTRIHVNGVYRYASLDLNGGVFFPDSVTFTIVASATGTGGADFNGAGGLPYSWNLKVRRCGAAAQGAAIVTSPPVTTLKPSW